MSEPSPPPAVPDPPATVRVRCPRCGKAHWITAADLGRPALCSACGLRFDAALPPPTPPVLADRPPVAKASPAPVPTVRSAAGCLVALAVVFALAVVVAVATAAWVFSSRLAAPAPPVSTATPAPSPVPVVRPVATRPTVTPVVVPIVVPPTRPATAPAVPTPAATRPTLPGLSPVRPPAPPPDLDARIGGAINRGVGFLLARFQDGRLPESAAGEGPTAGADALAVYALLQSATAVDRPDLAVDTPRVRRMLDQLGAMPMAHSYTTYDRSLRAAALAVYARAVDRRTLRADAVFLESQSRDGGYTYDPVPPATPSPIRSRPGLMPGGNWDNSNSQYGALGVWSAEDAGTEVSSRYWERVRQHWLASQLPTGLWGYTAGERDGRLTMTVAGLTTLLVAEDQLGAAAAADPTGRSPFTPAVARGLAWLEADDHAVTLPDDWPTYALYGIERAGLASGFKTFGRHDWYRELAARQLLLQQADGSWAGSGDPVVDTAFTLLFLARGRHPVLMDKLRFDGAWASRPNDLAHLTTFASRSLERPFNWQVVSVADDWTTWTDAPVLYLASHGPVPLTDAEVDGLRHYAENGGLIFTASDADTPAFDRFVADLAARLFPRYPLHDLPATDPVYSSLFPLDRATPLPPLRGVSNGSRLLMVHSPADVPRAWQLRETVTHPVPFQVGLNVFIDAAGRSDFRNRLRAGYVPPPHVTPVATTGLARVRYDGDWLPEPAAAERFARLFLADTSIAVTVTDVDAARLDAAATPVALLSGTGPVRLSAAGLRGLHAYVAAGGVLLADACGGSAAFRRSMRSDVLPHAFPEAAAVDLPADHPILAGTGAGMAPVDLRLRPFAATLDGVKRLPVASVPLGRGLVLFSRADVTTALLGTPAWGVDGYDPSAAYGLVRNALLWAVERPRGAGPV